MGEYKESIERMKMGVCSCERKSKQAYVVHGATHLYYACTNMGAVPRWAGRLGLGEWGGRMQALN